MPSDLIYREDAKDYVRHAFAKRLNVLEYLDEVPAANFRPVVRGRWIMPNVAGTDRPMPECSHCGWYVDNGGVKDFSFCPNCGADMRKEGEE